MASAVKHAEEVAKILRENVVQGKRVEGQDDKYSEFLFYVFSRGGRVPIYK